MFERATTVQGTLESVDSAVVSARIPGPLLRVCVDLGDAVKAGETVLFEVDPATVSNQVVIAREAAATARAQVAVAEANVAKAGAVARKAVRDAERFARLHAEGRVSDNERERADTARETAEADAAVAEASLLLARQQVSQAEAQLSIAERQLSDATLLAPCDGVVSARLKEPGEMVGPGTPVVKVNGTAELKALAFLPARHFAEIVPGETAVEVRANGGEAVKAVVAAKSSWRGPRAPRPARWPTSASCSSGARASPCRRRRCSRAPPGPSSSSPGPTASRRRRPSRSACATAAAPRFSPASAPATP